MSIKYIAVGGTHAAKHKDWDLPDSKFNIFLMQYGIEPIIVDPLKRYAWSTALDGVDSTNYTWDAAGRALMHYIVPPLGTGPTIPAKDTYIITHSHGGNVVAYACGRYGLKVEGLITVSMPIRGDMQTLYELTATNVQRHLHIHSGWKDFWQVLGSAFDGRLGIHREHPYAKNVKVAGGHGSILRDPKHFPLWVERGWLDFFIGAQDHISKVA